MVTALDCRLSGSGSTAGRGTGGVLGQDTTFICPSSPR